MRFSTLPSVQWREMSQPIFYPWYENVDLTHPKDFSRECSRSVVDVSPQPFVVLVLVPRWCSGLRGPDFPVPYPPSDSSPAEIVIGYSSIRSRASHCNFLDDPLNSLFLGLALV